MAHTPSVNFSPIFQVSSASTDTADVTIGTVFLSAVDLHTHDTNKGAAVWRLRSGVTGSLPAAGTAGRVYVATDSTKFFYYDDGAAQHTVVTLDQAQTITGVKTMTAPVLTHPLIGGSDQPTTGAVLGFAQTGPAGQGELNVGDGAANHRIVTTDNPQTLTNKTLTTPALSAATPTSTAQVGYGGGHLNVGDGAANHVLVDTDSVQTLSNKTFNYAGLAQPNASRYLAGALTLTSGAQTQVTIDTSNFDTDTMTSAANVLTAKTAGTYLVMAQVQFSGNAATSGIVEVEIYKNGTAEARVEDGIALAFTHYAITCSVILPLLVNDTLKIMATQTSGSNMGLDTGYNLTWLAAVRVSA